MFNSELKPNYGKCKEYRILERVFEERHRLEKSVVVPKAQKELGACSLQSPDDWEATIREVGSGLKQGYVAKFAVTIYETCPFQKARECPTRYRKHKQFYGLYFLTWKMMVALRRRRNQVFQKTKQNPRAAIEATVRAIKLPFPKGKLPVRGRFRMFYMMIGSAAIINVRQIQRHLASKINILSQESFCLFRRKCIFVFSGAF